MINQGDKKIAPVTADENGWEEYQLWFPANLEKNYFTRLEFHSAGTNESYGNLIDNVSVVRSAQVAQVLFYKITTKFFQLKIKFHFH